MVPLNQDSLSAGLEIFRSTSFKKALLKSRSEGVNGSRVKSIIFMGIGEGSEPDQIKIN